MNRGQGPIGIILGPSRELMRQTAQVARLFPGVHVTLAIGGEASSKQLSGHRAHGTHILVGTPGRVNDYLSKGTFDASGCTYLVLDEADRMLDLGFDEDVQRTLGFFGKRPRQTLLFSATMPRKFVDFAQASLVDPITINVGRAGSASKTVTQHVEYVKVDKKAVAVLKALQMSEPPVLVFASKTSDVDVVNEYLLLKAVDSCAIHGGKTQEERNEAVDAFRSRKRDVLVATDVAAKGLDFPRIRHVINYDMPDEIENYVHRIGRTGRGGAKGIATTLIDKTVDESSLSDLTAVFQEADQRIPKVLKPFVVEKQEGVDESVECGYCGGLGHSISACPKLAAVGRKRMSENRDAIKGGEGF